jgi:hypothetical protein
MTSNPAKIQTNVPVPFPANLTGVAPVSLHKNSGAWTASLNPNSFLPASSPVGALTLVYNPTPTPHWNTVPVASSGYINYLSSDYTVTNNTIGFVPNFIAPVLIAGKYLIHGYFLMTGGASSGVALALTIIGAGFSYCASTISLINAASGVIAVQQVVNSLPILGSTTTGNVTGLFDVEVDIIGQSAFLLGFGQNVSGGNPSTLHAGGCLLIYQISN